jgi:hypothetical protein
MSLIASIARQRQLATQQNVHRGDVAAEQLRRDLEREARNIEARADDDRVTQTPKSLTSPDRTTAKPLTSIGQQSLDEGTGLCGNEPQSFYSHSRQNSHSGQIQNSLGDIEERSESRRSGDTQITQPAADGWTFKNAFGYIPQPQEQRSSDGIRQ